MKTKKVRISLLAVALIAIFFSTPVYALENNSELNESYGYSPYYWATYGPAAYTYTKALGYQKLGLDQAISPVDVAAKGDNLYVLSKNTNAVYILDKEFKLVSTITEIKGELVGPNTLNTPEGFYIIDKDNIYIADTLNQRILWVDSQGNLIKEYVDPGIKLLGEVVTFFPSKIAVDGSGRMYVVGKNINRGIIELSKAGEFNTFIGAPKVKASVSDFLRRMFMTDEQVKRMEKFIPTEYNNVTIDKTGFLYGTIGTIDADSVMQASYSSPDNTDQKARPLAKLSPSGSDVLLRRGNVPIIGELIFQYGDQSFICDVDVREDGIYSMLDQRHGKVFTYDLYGNLLYVFGSLGKQNGRFSSPSALCYFEDKLVVVDQISGVINVFEPTEYGKMLNNAIKLDYDGKFEEAATLWQSLKNKNSNLFLAYTGIGKMYYRDKDYKNSMTYFKASMDYWYYNMSKEKVRKETVTELFPVIFLVVVAGTSLIIVRGFIKKRRKGEDA